jgi:hypothetical protein
MERNTEGEVVSLAGSKVSAYNSKPYVYFVVIFNSVIQSSHSIKDSKILIKKFDNKSGRP